MSKPSRHTSSWISCAEPPPAVDGPLQTKALGSPRTARSNATHASTFECVKWRRGPRTSQMPSSGWSHAPSRKSSSVRCSDHAWSSAIEAVHARLMQHVHHLAVHVELELLVRRVADAHRARARVAGEPRQLVLGDAALPADAVEDLRLRRIAGDRAQQPVAPRARLVGETGVEQRVERERRVAQPAVAVVPVALAADPLRQRRRRRGDDAAGRLVRERLQHDERRAHGLAVLALVPAAAEPLAPVALGVLERLLGVDRRAAGPDATGTRSSTNGTRSPARTVKSAPCVMSLGSRSIGVRSSRPSGPPMARSDCAVERGASTERPSRSRAGSRAPCASRRFPRAPRRCERCPVSSRAAA